MHNGTDKQRRTAQNDSALPTILAACMYMMLIIGAALLVTIIVVTRLRAPRVANPPNLGWMSEQWLAEHRAMHPS